MEETQEAMPGADVPNPIQRYPFMIPHQATQLDTSFWLVSPKRHYKFLTRPPFSTRTVCKREAKEISI